MWHVEVTALLLREVVSVDDFENRVAFGAIATVNLLEPGRAFMRGALRRDGRELQLQDFVEIAQRLRADYGVMTIEADRHGRLRTWSTDEVLVKAAQRGLRR